MVKFEPVESPALGSIAFVAVVDDFEWELLVNLHEGTYTVRPWGFDDPGGFYSETVEIREGGRWRFVRRGDREYCPSAELSCGEWAAIFNLSSAIIAGKSRARGTPPSAKHNQTNT